MLGGYDFDGNPIGLIEWAELFARWPERQVAEAEIGDVRVSTIWIGLDYSFGMGTPLIYETMIFGGDCDGECWRYPNWDAALAGHDQAVALARSAVEGSRPCAPPAAPPTDAPLGLNRQGGDET